jgi:SAM-dependent methyltransferase
MQEIAYKKTFEFEDTHWWFRARNRIVLNLVRLYASAPHPMILDYGCGTGKMLQELSSIGETWGCDSSQTALEYCRGRGIEHLIPYPEIRDIPKRFDIITLLDVLEHVDDDVLLISELKELLSQNGKLIITVPAYKCLWSGEDYVSEHKRRYTRKELSSCITGAGLRIVRMSYFNFILLPSIYSVIKIKALLKPESMKESDLNSPPSILNSTLYTIFRLEFPLLRHINMPFGASIFAIAEKQS